MRGWNLSWEILFAQSNTESTGSRLGVNYVQASVPTTTLTVSGTRSITVNQDLAKYGIAGVVWNCARAMVSFLEAESQFISACHVLELGAGPGGVGLALAASGCGVASLLLTDLEKVVPLTRENARSAAKQYASIAALADSHRLEVRALCWGEPLNAAAIADRPVDVVVASDCLYEPTSHSALLTTLLDLTELSALGHQQEPDAPLSTQRRAIVFLAYKQRVPTKEKAFFEAASMHFNVAVYSADNSMAIEYCDEAIYICKLERLR